MALLTIKRHKDSPIDCPPLFDFTGDASYPAGGYPVAIRGEFRVIQAMLEGGSNQVTLRFRPSFNPLTACLQLFDLTTGLEVAATTDVSATTFVMAVCGTS